MLLRLSFIFIILTLHIVLNHTSTAVDNEDCPKNFERSGNKCFFIPINQLSWLGANVACRRLKADLLTIENEAEMTAISEFLHKKIAGLTDLSRDRKSTWFWTSGNDIDKEGHHYWFSNGQPMTFERFAEGEPNNESIEDCFHLWYNLTTKQFEMNDYKCSLKLNFVCETQLKVDVDESLNSDAINDEVARLLAKYRVDGKLPRMEIIK